MLEALVIISSNISNPCVSQQVQECLFLFFESLSITCSTAGLFVATKAVQSQLVAMYFRCPKLNVAFGL